MLLEYTGVQRLFFSDKKNNLPCFHQIYMAIDDLYIVQGLIIVVLACLVVVGNSKYIARD